MINVRGNKKKVNKATNNFVDTKALYNNPQFTDGVAGVNNVKKIKSKIALPEEFAAEKVSKPINEQVEYLKSEKPLHVNDKKAIVIEKKLLKSFRVDPSTADRLDHEVYKYENKLAQQKQQAVSLWDDVVNRSQQYIKLFEGVASNSIFQGMASLAARVIAPPPTPEETKVIMDRLKALDPSLITDVYTISKIVQSPELLAYLKNLYEHVKNNVATNKDLQYIINIVKPIVDYIAINSDHFSMNGSPWLMEAYNKIKGSPFNSPMFAPGTASPVPVQTSDTNYNFQTNPTAPPMERHTDAPTTAAPTSIAQAPSFNPEQVGEIIKTYFELAFSDRAQLEAFYNSLANGTSTVPELNELSLFMRDKVINTTEATLTQLIQPLLDGLNGLSYVAQSIKNYIVNKGRLIIANNAFFFQPRATLTPTPGAPVSATPTAGTPPTAAPRHFQLGSSTPLRINLDMQHIMNRFNEAMTSNIATLKTLYFDILDKKDPIINKYIVLYDSLLGLDNMYEIDVDVAPGKIFIINLFNAFNKLNVPGLNDFKQILRSKADIAIISPNYQVSGALDIPPLESFNPINYVRPYNVEPSTIAQPYNEQPKLLSSTNAPKYTAQPTTGPQVAPMPEPIITGGSSLIKETPTIAKVKITRIQATKIINSIVENSHDIKELNKNINTVSETFNNIVRGAEIGGVLISSVAAVITIRKYLRARRHRDDYEPIPQDVIETERSKLSLSDLSKTAANNVVKMAVRANVSVVSLFDTIINFVRDLTGTRTVPDIEQQVQNVQAQLEEIIIEPTAGPSEIRARERVQQAMTRQNTATTAAAREVRATQHAERVMQTRVARTIEAQPAAGQEIDVMNAGEELRKLREIFQTKQAMKAIKEQIKNKSLNQINNQLTGYLEQMEIVSNNSQGVIESVDDYEKIYRFITDFINNYKSILQQLGVPNDKLLNSNIPNLKNSYQSILSQFMGANYDIIINKINLLMKLIEPHIQSQLLLQKLYLILSSAKIICETTQNKNKD
jgi:hypothetical protein